MVRHLRDLLRGSNLPSHGQCLSWAPPLSAGKGGMRQQLMALKAGRHLVTGMRLPAPSSSEVAMGSGTYTRLKPSLSGDVSFVPYVPREVLVPSPSGDSAPRKRWLMRGRVLCKEASMLRRRRRRVAKIEDREAISSFVGDADVEGDLGVKEPGHGRLNTDDDDDCEQFWACLPVEVSRERHILDIPTEPDRCFPGKVVKSREAMLLR